MFQGYTLQVQTHILNILDELLVFQGYTFQVQTHILYILNQVYYPIPQFKEEYVRFTPLHIYLINNVKTFILAG